MAAPKASAPPPRSGLQTLFDALGDARRGAVVLALVVFALFGSAIRHHATLDSMQFLAGDPRVREFRVGELLTKGYWNPDPFEPTQRQGAGDLYRPLTLLWMAAGWQLAGDEERAEVQPYLLNLGDIVLHALGVVLRFWLLLRLLAGRPRAGPIAFFAALLLAVHPVATEAVATQVGAAEGLVAVFGTGALLAWHRWQAEGSRRHALWFGALLFLGLLSKENAIAIAAVAPLGTLLVLRRSWGAAVRVAAVAAVPVVLWATLRMLVGGAATIVKDPVLAGYGPVAALQSALAAIGWYDLPALLWPFRLLAVVSHQALWPPESFLDWRVLLGIAAITAILGALLATWRRSPVAAFGLLFFAVASLPVSNLIVPIGALAATRFLYLPMTGLALAAALGTAALLEAARLQWRRIGVAVAVGAPLLFAVATLREVPVWQSEVTLGRAMTARIPDSMFLHGLAGALQQEIDAAQARGDQQQLTQLRDEARRSLDAALALPRPTIPGTDAVPEDVLEILYQAGTSRAVAAVQWDGDFDTAIANAERIRDLARQGAKQSVVVHGQANWRALESDAECMIAEFTTVRAQREPADSARRTDLLASSEQHIAAARAIAPEALRPDEQRLRVLALRGDMQVMQREFEQVYRRARPLVAQQSVAGRLALGYAALLDRAGDKQRATAILLETVMAAPDRFTGTSGLFGYGMRGIDHPDPAVRELARQALETFLQRAVARDAANVAIAKRVLGRR